jgi:long-chain acyl-CoA synthetase
MKSHLTQPLKRAALLHGRATATIDGERTRTWSEVADRVPRLAAGLRALGIGAGDRVAILALNSDRYLELHFAIAWAGAAMVPVNTRLAPPEIAYILKDADPVAIFVDESQRAALEQIPVALAGMKSVISLSDQPAADRLGYEAIVAGHQPVADALVGGSDMAGIFYTGGSSGRSKGVILSHDNLSTNAMNAVHQIGYDRTSVYLHAAPMFHLTDGMSTYSVTMVGGTHVFLPRFDARAAMAAVERHGVTNLCLVPTMVEMLVGLCETEPFEAGSLRQVQFGASPMPQATLDRAVRLWPNLLFLHGWGMTEISPLGLMLPLEWRDPRTAGDRLKSCGVPMINEEAAILDGDGNECGPGEVGELVVRGAMVMQGYWNLPEETEKALAGGWLHTGDAAWRDEDGFFFIADRLKDMIISGGENVYSVEVESVISQCPGVGQVAVIGVPHALWGEQVHAIVVPRDGSRLDAGSVIAFCKARIAGYKCPKSVEFRAEPLPLTGAGKVFKRQLREAHAAAAAGAASA